MVFIIVPTDIEAVHAFEPIVYFKEYITDRLVKR